MILEGRCWKLADEIPIDGALLELKYVHMRLTDPKELAKYVLKSIRPEFSENCSPGDILVAGNRFGHGNSHVQAFRGMYGLGVGIVAEWMTRGAYRGCVIAGVPFMPKCPGISALCSEGDRIRVDFANGLFRNLTSGREMSYKPVPELIRQIVSEGGSAKYWMNKISKGCNR